MKNDKSTAEIGAMLANHICREIDCVTTTEIASVRANMTIAVKLSHAIGYADTMNDPTALAQIIRAMRDELFRLMSGAKDEDEEQK